MQLASRAGRDQLVEVEERERNALSRSWLTTRLAQTLLPKPVRSVDDRQKLEIAWSVGIA